MDPGRGKETKPLEENTMKTKSTKKFVIKSKDGKQLWAGNGWVHKTQMALAKVYKTQAGVENEFHRVDCISPGWRTLVEIVQVEG